MSETNKPAENIKPQPNQQEKPAPAPTPPRERNLRTGTFMVADSLDRFKRKDK
ncbi:hypothetical protein [Serratia sp. CY76391]|uniref:hypothetical protein n=1 Tax=Serratia sp. CY76391 TaxID=3383681 RepID=UPI003FA0738D